MKPHVYAEAIKAWADGAQIQYKTHHDEVFKDWIGMPSWSGNVEYRIKPAEPEREYPETIMTQAEIDKVCEPFEQWYWPTAAANAALRHAIDHGQVVTRVEFNRAVGDRQKRDEAVALAALEYINHHIDTDRTYSGLPAVKVSTDAWHINKIISQVK